MSEKWKKKHLHNRLDSMFSDLGEESLLPGLSIFDQLNGWIWEISTAGKILNISPDVESYLGYDPTMLLDQELSTISNFSLEELDLPINPAESAPAILDITFFQVDGAKQDATCQVLPIHEADQLIGWRGITLTEDHNQLPQPEAVTDQQLIEKDFSIAVSELPSLEEVKEVKTGKGSVNGDESRRAAVNLPPADVLTDEEDPIPVDEDPISRYQPREELRGFLEKIDNDPNRVWEPDEIQLVEQVHNQLELALENANLFQQTQEALAETDEQARKLRLLNEMSESLAQAETAELIYQIATDTALKVFSATQTSIALWTEEKDTLQIRAATGVGTDQIIGTKVPREFETYWQPVLENKVTVISEINRQDLHDVRSSVAGPIYVGGEVQGSVNVSSRTLGFYDHQDATFMVQLLSILNASLENRELLDGIQRALSSTEEQARRLAVLNQLSEAMGQAGTMEEVIRLTMAKIDEIIPCKVCATAIFNPELDAHLTYEILQGESFNQPVLIPADNTLVQHISEQKQLISDYDFKDTSFVDGKRWIEEHQISSLIGAPLMSGETVIGAIMVGNQKEFSYSLQDEALLLSISSLLASTLDNRQLFHQIQRRSTQLETSAEVSRIASTILDPNELLPEVVERIKTGFDLYYAGIFLVDEEGVLTGDSGKWAVLRAGTGAAGQRMMAEGHKLEVGGTSMIGTAIAKAQAQITLDLGEEAPQFRNLELPETRSEMALPLRSRGKVLGAISIQSDREAAFSKEDVTSLQTMADQLANAIENARLFEQTEERAKELLVLNEMARAYTQTMDVEALFQHTYTYTNQLLDAGNFYLALFNENHNTIDFRLFIENNEKIAPPEPKIVIGNGLTDWIVINKLPVLIPKNVEEEMVSMGIEPRGRTASAYLGVPMMIGREVIGVIAIQSYLPGNTYTQHDLDLLSAISSQAAVAIDNAIRFQQTQTKAQFEQVMREITTRVHSTSDPDLILKTAVREVSRALGREAFIELNTQVDKPDPGSPSPKEQPKTNMSPKTQPLSELRLDDV